MNIEWTLKISVHAVQACHAVFSHEKTKTLCKKNQTDVEVWHEKRLSTATRRQRIKKTTSQSDDHAKKHRIRDSDCVGLSKTHQNFGDLAQLHNQIKSIFTEHIKMSFFFWNLLYNLWFDY